MERCNFLATYVADHNIFGVICFNRDGFTVGCGDPSNGHVNLNKHDWSDVAVEYNAECRVTRQLSCGLIGFDFRAISCFTFTA